MAEAPVNVRVVLLDDTEVPIELVYVGWDLDEGVHRWEQIRPEPIPRSVFKGAHVDKLPSHTLVAICIDEER